MALVLLLSLPTAILAGPRAWDTAPTADPTAHLLKTAAGPAEVRSERSHSKYTTNGGCCCEQAWAAD